MAQGPIKTMLDRCRLVATKATEGIGIEGVPNVSPVDIACLHDGNPVSEGTLDYDTFRSHALDCVEILFYFSCAIASSSFGSGDDEAREQQEWSGAVDRAFKIPFDMEVYRAEFWTKAENKLEERALQRAILTIDIMIATLWLLLEEKHYSWVVPLCLGRFQICSRSDTPVEFASLSFHQFQAKLTPDNSVAILKDSSDWFGWHLAPDYTPSSISYFTNRLPPGLLPSHEVDPDGSIRKRESDTNWKYVWYPNYVEFYHNHSTQLVSGYQLKEQKGSAPKEWDYISVNGAEPATGSLDGHASSSNWSSNALRFEREFNSRSTLGRNGAGLQPSGSSYSELYKISVATSIPFGRLDVKEVRSAYALYMDLIIYQRNVDQSEISQPRDGLRSITSKVHRSIDDLRYIAVSRLAQERVLELEELERDLSAQLDHSQSVLRTVKGINEVISSLQLEVHKVNVLVQPPERSIMSAYALVSEFFEQAKPIKLNFNTLAPITFRVRHNWTDGDVDKRHALLALCCVIQLFFGASSDADSFNEAIASNSTESIVNAIKEFVREKKTSKHALYNSAAVMLSAVREKIGLEDWAPNVLESIKNYYIKPIRETYEKSLSWRILEVFVSAIKMPTGARYSDPALPINQHYRPFVTRELLLFLGEALVALNVKSVKAETDKAETDKVSKSLKIALVLKEDFTGIEMLHDACRLEIMEHNLRRPRSVGYIYGDFVSSWIRLIHATMPRYIPDMNCARRRIGNEDVFDISWQDRESSKRFAIEFRVNSSPDRKIASLNLTSG